MDIAKILVPHNISIKDAVRVLDQGGYGIIVIVENTKVVGIVTDGDFRRALLNGVSLDEDICSICNRNFVYLNETYTKAEVEVLFRNTKIKHIPILEDGKLRDVLTDDLFFGIKSVRKEQINVPVVIMAGGKGTRLDPFTRILPKPLIPIGNKTILEVIIEKFLPYAIKDFYLTVNYKAIIIKSYFEELEPTYNVHFITEKKPLGTVGALKYLDGKFDTPIILTNCDILINADYASLIKHHQKEKNDITLVTSLKYYNIPYGICEIENGGELKEIREKPEYNFLVSTGMYVLNPSVIKLIPENVFFHITHLIKKVKNNGGKVGVFPISEKAWIDTGEWPEYKKAIESFRL